MIDPQESLSPPQCAAAAPAALESSAPLATAAPRPGLRLWAVSMGFCVLVACIGYALTGRPDAWWQAPPATAELAQSAQGSEPTAEQVNEMVARLAQRLKDRPQDAQGWAMLARSYLILGRLEEAQAASARVLELLPDDPQALVDHADVLAMRNGRTLEGEPMRLIERALKIDPDNLKALALAGAAAFDRGRMDEAARLWDRVALLGPPGSPLVQQAREGAEEARRQSGTRPAADPNAVQLAGEIRVAPALAGRVAPDDTVFVFARAADAAGPPPAGPPMPLAALKARARDLPLKFALGPEHAMAPGGLSGARQVIVTVRISRTGQPSAQPGDLEGRSGPISPGHRDLRIEIDRMLP